MGYLHFSQGDGGKITFCRPRRESKWAGLAAIPASSTSFQGTASAKLTAIKNPVFSASTDHAELQGTI